MVAKLKVDRIGSAAIARVLKAWLATRDSTDLKGILGDMMLWSRAMPLAKQMVDYVDLVTLFVLQSNQLAFSAVEIVNALGELHSSYAAEGKRFLLGELPFAVECRKYAGTLVNALARYRDLRTATKQAAVFSKASCGCGAHDSSSLIQSNHD